MKIFKSLFTKAAGVSVLLALASCASTGSSRTGGGSISSKAASFFRPTDINEKVYVLPHKPLLIKSHINPNQPLPMPGPVGNSTAVPYIIQQQAPSASLVKPPKRYQIPAATAPEDEFGEDEAVKARRREENPNAKATKKSIFSLFSPSK